MKNILKHPLKLSKKSAVLLGLAAFALSTSSAFAQAQCLTNTTWRGGTGSWFIASNWNNGVPTSSINAQVNNGGTAQIATAIGVGNACSLAIGPGNVTVNATTGGGLLNVTDSVVVGSNGVLTLTNGGTVNAGNVTVSGTLDFNVVPSTSGSVKTSGAPGTVTLNSSSTLNVTMTGTFTPGTRYTLLTATGGVTGTFSHVTITRPPGPPCYTPRINYDANHVYLDLQICTD